MTDAWEKWANSFTMKMKMSSELHVHAALPPEEASPVPINRRLEGPQSRSGRCAMEKNN
jgi:hypothetical protein